MADCLTERLYIFDDFLPGEKSASMRADIDAHFANPYSHRHETHDVWNYWHVPGQYNYLRTTPEKIIQRDKVAEFVAALRSLAAVKFGFAEVTWPFFGLYVPGCSQNLHNDATNGQLGYVYSLTRNERQTIGGETMVVHERDLFRSSLRTAAAGRAMFDLVEPRFNRLTLFDDRIPHAVQRVDGSMDPLEGRFVLHGHVREGGVVAQGPLPPNAIQELVVEVLKGLRERAGGEVNGPFVLTVEIGSSGDVEAARPIFDRLASTTSTDLDEIRADAIARVKALKFPAAASSTKANIPLMF
jgi:Rps23 Pro-64 3,4-dihydroxylase Tpa1-like proline 4-hydroxylase